MDIFLKIPTDWVSYPKPYLKELRGKYTSSWDLTQPLLDILIRIPYIEYVIYHQANTKQYSFNSLPTIFPAIYVHLLYQIVNMKSPLCPETF